MATQPLSALAFPDVMDRSMRDVVEICSIYQVDCTLLGEGYATAQKSVGSPPLQSIEITFEPYKLEAVEAVLVDQEE